MKDGVRDSASRAYLHPISHRSNLHMKKYSMVKKILIDPKTAKAYGVEFVRKGQTYRIFAKKEVILSAGAINSPQLLMLSGIGPKKHLTSLGIPVTANLKVGYNLMDHIGAGGLIFIIDKPYALHIDDMTNKENLKLYLSYHKGPGSSPQGAEVLVFHDFFEPKNQDGYPEVELLFFSASILSFRTVRKSLGIKEEIYDAMYTSVENLANSFMVVPILMRPKSKGRIVLRDNNYKSKPLIYPNYLSEQEDIEIILKGVRLILNITSQPTLQALGTRLHSIPIPQCADKAFGSDDYFDCMTRYFTYTLYHYSGTCKMGPPTDKQAVVDPRLRVYGVKNLRVIDASIIPEVPAAHINSATYMIAEKGADMIKEGWGFKN